MITVTGLIASIGAACAKHQFEHFRNHPCNNTQCDEIWSFCYSKQKKVPEEKQVVFGYDDVWTFTAVDADTKLVPS